MENEIKTEVKNEPVEDRNFDLFGELGLDDSVATLDKGSSDPTVVLSPPVTEPVPVVEPTPTVVATPVVTAPVVEPTPTLTPTPVTPVEPAAGTPEYYEKIIIGLRSKIDEMSVLTPAAPVAPESPKPVAPVTQPTPPVIPQEQPTEVDFVGNASLDDLLDTKDGLNKLLNMVANEAAKRSSGLADHAYERYLTNMPTVITRYIANMATMKRVADEFYTTNSDLSSYKRVVASMANHLSAEHPDWDQKKVLEETAIQARRSLGLIANASAKTLDNPAFVTGTPHSKTMSTNVKSLEQEVADLIGG